MLEKVRLLTLTPGSKFIYEGVLCIQTDSPTDELLKDLEASTDAVLVLQKHIGGTFQVHLLDRQSKVTPIDV